MVVRHRWRRRGSGEAVEYLGQADAQRVGDHAEVEDRYVALAALDGTDERAVKLALVRELGLGQTAGLAALADAVADFTEEVGIAPC